MIDDIEQAWKTRRDKARRRKVARRSERWLRAEAAATPEAADRSLRRVFFSIPRPAPTAGFTERVLARVLPHLPESSGALARDPFARGSVRWAIAVSFVLVGIVFGGLPQFIAAIGGQLRAGMVIDVARRVPMVLSDALTGFVGLWPLATSVGASILSSVSSPWFLTVVVTLALTAVATVKVVTEVLVRQKGFTHVHLA